MQYTSILPADCNGQDAFGIWPNPVHDLLTINIGVRSQSPAIVKVFDAQGALVRQKTATLLRGNNLLTINMAGLASAVYYLVIAYDNNTRTQQIMKH